MKHRVKNSVKPRNSFVAAMRFRKSGVHVKSNKALRKNAKDNFRKEIRDAFVGGLLTPPSQAPLIVRDL